MPQNKPYYLPLNVNVGDKTEAQRDQIAEAVRNLPNSGGGTLPTWLIPQVNTNTSDIGTLKTEVSDNTSNISTLTTNLSNLTTTVNTNYVAIGALQSDVTTNTTNIGIVQAQTVSNLNAITAMGTQLDDVIAIVDDLRQDIIDTETNVFAIQDYIQPIAANAFTLPSTDWKVTEQAITGGSKLATVLDRSLSTVGKYLVTGRLLLTTSTFPGDKYQANINFIADFDGTKIDITSDISRMTGYTSAGIVGGNYEQAPYTGPVASTSSIFTTFQTNATGWTLTGGSSTFQYLGAF